jgi:hypothetical protein
VNLRARGLLGRLVARVLESSRIPDDDAIRTQRFRVERDDLLARCTRDEIESHERAVDPMGGAPAVPFGHLNAAWQRFVARLRADDELWRFHAQRMARDGAAQIRTGYVIVRDGRPGEAMIASVRTSPPRAAADRSSPRCGQETAAAAAPPSVTLQ